MPTDVIMPQMGESIVEGTITKWLKKAGDRVEKDEPLFEISTDKVDAEIPSPVAGVLSEIKVPEGATVGINTVVAVIGGASAESAAPAPQPKSAPQQVVATTVAAETEIVMPQMGESIVEGIVTKWLKKVGDKVEKDEPLFEISTDKVDAEIPAPVAGFLREIKVPEGATVDINTVVAVIGGACFSSGCRDEGGKGCHGCCPRNSSFGFGRAGHGQRRPAHPFIAFSAAHCEGKQPGSEPSRWQRVRRPHHEGRRASSSEPARSR